MVERRRATDLEDHDLLISIHANQTQFSTGFNQHLVDNKEDFALVNKRLSFLERSYWVGIGILAVIQWFVK